MKIKSILVEDEPHSMSRLRKLLNNFDNIEIIGEAIDGDSAIDIIEKDKPDLLFLDINIPGKNGFEVLKNLTYKPKVIFVTAYEKYAVQAFEENAIDYILKPTNIDRLKQSIDKVIKNDKKSDQDMMDILEKLTKNEKKVTRYSIKDKDEITVVHQNDIFYFKAQEKYTFLCTYDEEHFYDASLKKIEENMDKSKFIRIHKSYIVSLDGINKLQKLFLREYVVEMKDKNKTILKVGRNYLKDLKEKLNF